MALFEGLLGGGGGSPLDLYGDLFTPEQKAALQQRELSQGLFRMAEKLGQAAMPSRVPVSTLGALGQGLGAFGTGSDMTEQALKGMQVAEQVRQSQQERAILAKAAPLVERIASQLIKAGVSPQVATQIATQTAGGAPGASGAPTGGPLASNAPPPLPPIGSSPADYLSGFTGAPGTAPGGGDFPGATAPGPQQQSGLLPPPPGANPQMGQGGGLLAGLPFDQTAPGAAGADLSNIRIEPLSGEAAPAGVDLPFPTKANPNKPKSAWEQGYTYDQPKVPFGQAPGDVGPGAAPSELARLSQLMRVETLAKPAAAAPSNLTGSNWEVANNNLGGMRRPGVNATPSQGGFQTFPTPEAGLAAISNQLDRYASGATTGKPLSTIREIVSTWAPPSENDTEGLIKRATRIMGVADNIPLNVRDPAVKAKLIEATVRNEQGGKLPVDPALVAKVAQAPPGSYAAGGQDIVLPPTSGPRGIPASALQRVADTGAAPGTGTSGTIPGLGVTPEALAALNAMLKMGGVKSDPFGSLLETYYKSPGYLVEKARTEAQAQKGVALEMDPLIAKQTEIAKSKVELEYKPQIEEAVQKLQSPILKEREQAKADIARVTKQIEQTGAAALTPTTATVYGPGGEIITQPLTQLELAQRQLARAERMAKGDTTYQPGDIVGTPIGAAPAEHRYVMTPQGELSAVPVPGTPAAEKAAETANKKLQTEQAKLISRDTVVREVDNISKLMESATLPTTGFGGSLLQNLGGTAANDIRIARQTLESRLSADALNAERARSPTGAAFGNTSDTDVALLRTALVNLDQSQTKQQFQERLQILKQAYVDAVHGPGMSRLLPETPVLKSPATTAPSGGGPIDKATFDRLPSGTPFTAPDGSRRIKP